MGRGVITLLSPATDIMAVAGALLVRVGPGAARDIPAWVRRRADMVESFILKVKLSVI